MCAYVVYVSMWTHARKHSPGSVHQALAKGLRSSSRSTTRPCRSPSHKYKPMYACVYAYAHAHAHGGYPLYTTWLRELDLLGVLMQEESATCQDDYQSFVMYLLMSAFPYSGFMAMQLIPGLTQESAGTYAGILSGSFMIGRLFSAYPWGMISDRYGRKFVPAELYHVHARSHEQIATLFTRPPEEPPIRLIQFRNHMRYKNILVMRHQTFPHLRRPEL